MSVPTKAWGIRGWITPCVRSVVVALTSFETLFLGAPLIPGHYTEEQWHEMSERRSRRVDTFVAVCLLLEIGCFVWVCRTTTLRWVALAFVIWRIIDILATDVRVSLFEGFDRRRDPELGRDLRFVYSSPSRVIILGVINYLELIVCFAAIYGFGSALVTGSGLPEVWLFGRYPAIEKCLHLSFITQITVGYGDFVPTGWLRPVAWLQSFAGLGSGGAADRAVHDGSARRSGELGRSSRDKLPIGDRGTRCGAGASTRRFRVAEVQGPGAEADG